MSNESISFVVRISEREENNEEECPTDNQRENTDGKSPTECKEKICENRSTGRGFCYPAGTPAWLPAGVQPIYYYYSRA
jgi:hypothetical protein